MSACAKVARVLACGLALAGCAHRARGHAERDVRFTRYSPLSRNEELLRRVLTPLALDRGRRVLAENEQQLVEQSIDLARERFTIYVPAGEPPAAGWGLLVFVAPWNEATEPRRWRPPLDRHGVVFVAATNSGNGHRTLERRLPLALLAWENVRARLPIDPARTYVGGFSGGSRVAQVAALAYPDVFRGALLDAGSYAIGGGDGVSIPPAELFRRFQETRVVYVTGAEDGDALDADSVSQASLREWCVLDLEVLIMSRTGHKPLDATWLDRALAALERPRAVDPAALAECNEKLRRRLAAELAEVEGALARGDREGARVRLGRIDARYAGLAARELRDLQARLAGGAPP